jgi:hypothetical protein
MGGLTCNILVLYFPKKQKAWAMEEKGNQATIDAMKYREKIEENKYIWINLKGLVKLLGFHSKMIGLQYARS